MILASPSFFISTLTQSGVEAHFNVVTGAGLGAGINAGQEPSRQDRQGFRLVGSQKDNVYRA